MLPLPRIAAAVTIGLGVAACAPSTTPIPDAGRPSLLLLITVDQMRPDYLERFGAELSGGLARLTSGGAYFVEAYHDHAITETAPGHATLGSGRFPSRTGITRNIAGVNDRDAPLIGAPDLGASPRRFRGTTLVDWMIAADGRTRALSVSAKDRAAILPVGRSKQEVYWYANNGTFTTSDYYRDTLPDWVATFNRARLAHNWAGRAWNLLRDPSAYPEPDSVVFEGGGRNITFPHVFPADSARAAAQVRFSPLIDELTLRFALSGVRTLGLGQGPGTDVLAVSLSATDYVGHFYGPESREQHDNILRLDRVLGAFLDTLYTLRDSTRIVIALSSDHAVSPIPELHGRFRIDMGPVMQVVRDAIASGRGDTTAVDLESGAFFVDPATLAGSGLSERGITDIFMTAARQVPGVMRVDRFSDLTRANFVRDPIARRWVQMFPPDIAPTAVVTLDQGNIYNYPIIATHGSPHDYDAHVPLIFYGPGFTTGRFTDAVRTVDLAPTLAARLGVRPLETLDGKVLRKALR